MSRLNPSLLPLDKGLNLQTAKLLAPEGSALDMLNYEQVDFQGQKRIDGYVRYDGSLGNYQDTFYRLTGVSAAVDDVVSHTDGTLVGVVVDTTDGVVIALINKNYVPAAGMELSIGTVATAVELRDELTPAQQYLEVLANNQALRNRVTSLPGPVAGLHWFEDRLYAVASVTKLTASGTYYPNEEYNGHIVLESGSGYVYVDGIDPSTSSGSTIASLFQSRDEQQAFDETGSFYNYGWSFIHQGWEVPFEAGISLYGELTALNQNRQDVGVLGPSSVVDTNGSPIQLTQKVQASNFRPQVNGWKNYNSPENYSLSPTNIYRPDDAAYIYADAHITWTQTEVTAATEQLVEYLATATVEVSV